MRLAFIKKFPTFMLQNSVRLLIRLMYRLHVEGVEHLPKTGGAIFVCNHVSFVDVMVIAAVSPRPVRFLMDYRLFNAPVLKWFSIMGRAIPIATAKENEQIKNQAFLLAEEALRNGEVIALFPEGSITRDGNLALFKRGIEELIMRVPVPVVPMGLRNMWGSFFSRKYNGKAMSSWPRRFRSRISLHIGVPIPAEQAKADLLYQTVRLLIQAPK